MPRREGQSTGWRWTLALCALLAGVGLSLFALALRPCRFVIEPGESVAWELTVRSAASGEATAAARATRMVIRLLGLGPEPEAVAWFAGPSAERASAFHLAMLPVDGALRLRTPEGRIALSGPHCLGFDFNLLPLPPGAEQSWRASVVWAPLPPDKQLVPVEVRRLRANAWPEFRCLFPPSIEWVDPHSGRYRQVRGLAATYRFDTLRGLPVWALVRWTLREELPPPQGFASRDYECELRFLERRRHGEPAALRQAAALAQRVHEARAAGQRPALAWLAALQAAGEPFASLAGASPERL
ncbi:MAG: hypothetical protein RMM29_00260 [Planctomycetota bacterium]|nr:hypothetical protein [Planctomycetota bacterium]MDW8372067.1 hypothetical protein [Planctomycetota bacterium]